MQHLAFYTPCKFMRLYSAHFKLAKCLPCRFETEIVTLIELISSLFILWWKARWISCRWMHPKRGGHMTLHNMVFVIFSARLFKHAISIGRLRVWTTFVLTYAEILYRLYLIGSRYGFYPVLLFRSPFLVSQDTRGTAKVIIGDNNKYISTATQL